MNGTLLQDGDRYVLRFERHLAHPVERVWRAVTEPAELAHWFPGQPRIELRVGGKATFAEPGFDVDPELLPAHGTVTELDPPQVFGFLWGEDVLRFELTPDGDGCVLVFTHTFANRASAPRSAAGWSVCLDAFAAHLDGLGAPAAAEELTAADRQNTPDAAPEPGDAGDTWHNYFLRYGQEFGSNGVLCRQGDSTVLRFERLLERPAGDAWDALTRPERVSDWLAEATIEAVEGGAIEFRFAPPTATVVTGIVRRLEPPRVIEYTWTSPGEPDGVVKWQLIPAGDRCLLLLTHTVHGRGNEAGTLATWDVHLNLLGSALAGRPTWPFPESRWSELREEYAAALA